MCQVRPAAGCLSRPFAGCDVVVICSFLFVRELLQLLPADFPPVGSSAGHLLSTAQVESALVEHEAVAEAAVVGRPHRIKGESLYCFVTLIEGVTYSCALEAELKKQGEWKVPSGHFSEAFC